MRNSEALLALVAVILIAIASQLHYLSNLQKSFGDVDLQAWTDSLLSNLDVAPPNNNNSFDVPTTNNDKGYQGSTTTSSVAFSDTVSACLLVMDENFRLPEFLSYHYHILPLRYLIIAIDPRSQYSPKEILNRFRRDMKIIEWSDENFTDWDPLPSNASQTELRARHRERQKRFYEACMTHLHYENRTWTTMYDSDEFLSLRDTSKKELISKEGWFMKYIHDHNLTDAGCFSFPRVLFGAQEIPSNELYHDLPDGLEHMDAMRLDTLRYRYHAYHGHELNGHGKAIIDVSKIRDHLPLHGKVPNPHRPLSICNRAMYGFVKDSPFLLHHYLGSWEAYSFRQDSRKHAERSREGWEYRASLDHQRNDQLTGWLKEFVALHGPKQVSILLNETGLSPDYQNTNLSDWAFDPTSPSYRNKALHKHFFQFLDQRNHSSPTSVPSHNTTTTRR